MLKSCIRKTIPKSEDYEPYRSMDKGILIGHGTYGAVYELGDHLAIKRMRFKDSSEKEAFGDAEIKMLRLLKGKPHVLQLLGYEIKLYRAKMVFARYETTLFQHLLNMRYPREPEVVLEIIRQIATGLKAAHECDIVHTDLKPDNILLNLSPSLHLVIGDWGCAEKGTRIFFDFQVGAVHYRAPELHRPYGHFTKEVDIWSFGCIMYELLIGFRLFIHKDRLLERMHDILERNGEMGRAIKDVMNRYNQIGDGLLGYTWSSMLQRDPLDRPTAAGILSVCHQSQNVKTSATTTTTNGGEEIIPD